MSTLLEDIIKLRDEVEAEKKRDYEEYEDANERGARNHEVQVYMSYICNKSFVQKLDNLIKEHSGEK